MAGKLYRFEALKSGRVTRRVTDFVQKNLKPKNDGTLLSESLAVTKLGPKNFELAVQCGVLTEAELPPEFAARTIRSFWEFLDHQKKPKGSKSVDKVDSDEDETDHKDKKKPWEESVDLDEGMFGGDEGLGADDGADDLGADLGDGGLGDGGLGDGGLGDEGLGDEGLGDEGLGDEGLGADSEQVRSDLEEFMLDKGYSASDLLQAAQMMVDEEAPDEGLGDEGLGDEGLGDEGLGDEGLGDEGLGDEMSGLPDEEPGLGGLGEDTLLDDGLLDEGLYEWVENEFLPQLRGEFPKGRTKK